MRFDKSMGESDGKGDSSANLESFGAIKDIFLHLFSCTLHIDYGI